MLKVCKKKFGHEGDQWLEEGLMIFLIGGTRVQCEESLPPIILAKHTSGLQKNGTVVSSFHFLRQIGRVKICLPDKKVFLHSCPAYTFILNLFYRMQR